MQEKTSREKMMDKMYITRKCRIWSAERYKGYDKIFSTINIYYSALLIIFSIITIKNSSIKTDVFLISASILVFSINTVGLCQNFKDIYLSFKENYLSLDHLYRKLDKETTITKEDLSKYDDEYNRLLNACPNHSTYDYYTMLMNDNYQLQKVIEMGKLKKCKIMWTFYLKKILYFSTIGVLFVAPFIIPLIIELTSYILSYCNIN